MITYVPVSPANFTLRVGSKLNFSYNYFRFSKFYDPTQIQRHSNWGFLLILDTKFLCSSTSANGWGGGKREDFGYFCRANSMIVNPNAQTSARMS